MNKVLSLLFFALSLLSVLAPIVAALVFVLLKNDDAVLWCLLGSVAGVVPYWFFMELSFYFNLKGIKK